jgi:hypothetical protein
MTVGLALGQAEINARAGALAIMLRDALRMCSDFCDLLQNTTIVPNDQYLLNMGFTQAEVNTLRAAFVDAKALRQVAIGAASQTPASNFLVNVLKLTGTSV